MTPAQILSIPIGEPERLFSGPDRSPHREDVEEL